MYLFITMRLKLIGYINYGYDLQTTRLKIVNTR